MANQRRLAAPLGFALAARALPPKIHCCHLQKLWIVPEVTKAKIAVLAKRAANHTSFMVMIYNDITNKTANYTFTYGSCLKGTRIF